MTDISTTFVSVSRPELGKNGHTKVLPTLNIAELLNYWPTHILIYKARVNCPRDEVTASGFMRLLDHQPRHWTTVEYAGSTRARPIENLLYKVHMHRRVFPVFVAEVARRLRGLEVAS